MIQRKNHLEGLVRQLASFPVVAILGSAAPELLRETSESLAGRVAFHELDGFALDEYAPAMERGDWLDERWLRGGFPRALLAASALESMAWRESFIRTYLERDIPQLGISLPALTLRRFWTMPAHYHGQTRNGSELGHPKCGASWEGFMVQELIRRTGAGRGEAFFRGLHAGAQLELLIVKNGRRIGFEIKLTRSPKVTASMRSARKTLERDRLFVVCHAEGESWPMAEGIEAVPAAMLASADWQPLMA